MFRHAKHVSSNLGGDAGGKALFVVTSPRTANACNRTAKRYGNEQSRQAARLNKK
jgi:hypothetical protein